jgi:hypothetical protein
VTPSANGGDVHGEQLSEQFPVLERRRRRLVHGLGAEGTLSDPVAGAGTLEIDGTATFEPGFQLNVTTLSVLNTGATLILDDNFTLPMAFVEGGQALVGLNGHSLTLNGQATLSGAIAGPGTMARLVTGKHVNRRAIGPPWRARGGDARSRPA